MREYVDVVVFDGFADWQIALALTEIRRPGDLQVRTLGFTPASVSAMSGFRVQPDLTVANWQPQHSALLLLPGCHPASAPLPAMSALARRAHMAEVALAAIDRGVSALAQTGLLDQQRHTANWPGQLGAEAPAYAGQRHYQADALAVREGRTITASQFGSIEFAREISALLQLYSSSDGEHWYRLFKHAIAPPWCGSVDAVRAA